MLIILILRKEERNRINLFCEQWNQIVEKALSEIQSFKESDDYFSDSVKNKYKKDYSELYKSYCSLDAPKREELKTKLEKFALFAEEYSSIDKTQFLHNEEFFSRKGKRLANEYKELFSSKRFIGHHEIKPFYLKWFQLVNDFFSLSDKDKYRDKPWANIYFKTHGNFMRGVAGLEEERKEANEIYKQNELRLHKTFFDSIFQYALDEQQRNAIITLEDNTLVVSSAGSGKTSTIVAKVRYLVEKKHIDPQKILVLTYTREAAKGLRDRMGIEGITSSTFHKHAMDTIGLITGKFPTIADKSILLNIFETLIDTDNDFINAINNYITVYSNLINSKFEYKTAAEYISDVEKYKLLTPYKDDTGSRRFVKSKQEWLISIILTELGVKFRYEEPYPIDTSTEYKRQYKPDFTIYYTSKEIDKNGKVSNVKKELYYEHWGIDADGRVPKWFGDGKEGGWQKAQDDYIEGIIWKKGLHSKNHTPLIETTSNDFLVYSDISTYIEELLNSQGVVTRHLTEKEKLELLKGAAGDDDVLESIFDLVNEFITLMKANNKKLDEIIDKIVETDKISLRNKTILDKVIRPVYEQYQNELRNKGVYDFTDVLLDASKKCFRNNPYKYEYILVDEFQDISIDKYEYLKSLKLDEPYTKIFCVGDDWQSIYRFSGSDMALFYNFSNYFGYTEECKIETTHRFGYPLLSASTVFVQTNPEQKEKEVKTTYKGKTSIQFRSYAEKRELETVKQIIRDIPESESIFILGRYKFNARSIGIKIDGNQKRESLSLAVGSRKIPYLTVHSAKGLEADHVIIINCEGGTHGFPSLIEDDPILKLVLSGADSFENAEERRVFYVAITRAKRSTYCLYDETNPSPFISEFGEYSIYPGYTSYVCPRCHKGYVRILNSGISKRDEEFVTVKCTRNSCDYYETLFNSKVEKYKPRNIIDWDEVDLFFTCFGHELQWIKNQRILFIENEDKKVCIPVMVPVNIVANQYTWNDLNCNPSDYNIAVIEYKNRYISILRKNESDIFVSDSDLEEFIRYIDKQSEEGNLVYIDAKQVKDSLFDEKR